MRKITLFFVALMSVLMLSAATETVYFVNANNWTGTIKAHLWGGTATGTSWNGNAMTKESEQIAGFDVYSYSAEAGAYANVIFNNGSAQTADLTWTAGKYYVKDGWYTKDEAVVKLGQPIEYETVYFVDAYKWGSVNIYTWTPEVGTWPGKAMTKESEQIAGYDVYSYTVEKGTSFGGLNFNCKGDNSKKTGDLKWTAGKYYVKDAWYTKEEAEKGLAPSVKLAGTLSSWDGTVMELSDDYKTASLTLTLDAKEYELKIIEEGAWFGNAGTMTRGNSSDWTFSSEVGDNCKITADVAGEYVFTWTFETNKLTVTYPELAPAITATWSIEEGAELESFTEATITFTGVESAKAKSSYSNYILYSVAEDGTLTLAENVPGYSSPGYLDTKASGTAVTFYDSEGMYDLASGNYRIVLPVGAIKFNNDNANLSTEEYVLNFVIKNNKVVLPEVDAVYTVNPENNATVTEIREIVLNFTGYEAIAVAEPDMVNGSNIPTVYFEDELTGSMMPAGYIMFKADSLSANGLRLYVDPMYTGGAESYATEGNYAINIPAGVVTFSDGINKAITLNYTVEAAPAEPEAISIADFLTKEVNAEVWYELTGVVSAISNTTYGNFDLIDETGTVYVYGLTATQVNPNDKSFATLGLENGDTLTLRGVRADYNGTAQVGGPAYYVSHKDYVAPEVVLPEGQSQETIDFTPTDVYANAEKLTVVDGTNISLTFAQNSGGTAPAWYTTGTAARLYGQNSLTVAAKEGYVLVSVQFVIGDKDIPSADNSTVTNGTYNYDTHTWTATEGADVTEMVLTNTKSSGHFRIQKVIVTLQEKVEEPVEPTPTIVEGIKLYIQLPATYTVVNSSVTFGEKATGGKLSPVKRGMSIGGGTTTTGTEMTNVDAENGVWEVVAPAGTSDSLFSVAFSFKGYTAACNIANLKYDGEHNLFTLSSDFAFDIRRGGTATEANGTWGVYPFPAPAITATWSIEEGAELESFTEVTITFTGVEAANTITMYPVCFYKVAADGTTTPVANDCTAGLLNRKASGASITLMVQEDEYDFCYDGKITAGNYRIVLSAGMVKFNNDNTNKNTEDYVLNFSIKGSDEPALEEIDAVYTVNPENNATVTEIREIVLNFTGYETIAVAEPDMATGRNIPTVYFEDELTGSMMPAGYIMFKADSLSANGLRLYVDPMYTGGAESYAAEGKYAINIPAGVVTFSDGINKAITLNYTIIEESLPMEVEFKNIAAIYEMGMWDMAYYESYDDYNVVALLKSQPTVVDKVVTSTMRGGNMNNYYLNDGTGVIVLQTEGDIINPIMDENYENIIGYDTIPGLNIEVGKKLPVDFMANINFKTVTDDETYLPTGEVYGAPVMTFVPKATGDTIVDEEGFETIVTESNEEFAARCEASDFVEEAVEANLDDVLANRIAYAGKLLVLDTTANYYAAVNPYMGGMSAYMYWDATEAFDVEVLEEEGTTVVYVSPKYTEDYNNFAGKLFNVNGEELPEAALATAATINVVNARFDWNSIAQGQTLVVKEGWSVEIPQGPQDNVENGELVVNIYSNNGSVYVETEAGAMIEVYTVNGLRVYAGVSNTNTTIINGLNTNIAIIRVNGETYKVFVK